MMAKRGTLLALVCSCSFVVVGAAANMGPSLGRLQCNDKPFRSPNRDCHHEVDFGASLDTLCKGSGEKLRITFDPAGSTATFKVSVMYSDVSHCDYPAQSASDASHLKKLTETVQVAADRPTNLGDALKLPSKVQAGGSCGPGSLILSLKDDSDKVVDAVSVPVRFKSCTAATPPDLSLAVDASKLPGSAPKVNVGDNVFDQYSLTKLTISNSASCPHLKAFVGMSCFDGEYPAAYKGYLDASGRVKFQEAAVKQTLHEVMSHLYALQPGSTATILARDPSTGEAYLDLASVKVPRPTSVDIAKADKKCVFFVVLDMFKECPDSDRKNNVWPFPFTVSKKAAEGGDADVCDLLPSYISNGKSAYFYPVKGEAGVFYSGGRLRKALSDFGMVFDTVVSKVADHGSLNPCKRQCTEMHDRLAASEGHLNAVVASTSNYMGVLEKQLKKLVDAQSGGSSEELQTFHGIAKLAASIGKRAVQDDKFQKRIVKTVWRMLRKDAYKSSLAGGQSGSFSKKSGQCGAVAGVMLGFLESLKTCGNVCGQPAKKDPTVFDELQACFCQVLWSPGSQSEGDVCKTLTSSEKSGVREVMKALVSKDLIGGKALLLTTKEFGSSARCFLSAPATTQSVKKLLDGAREKFKSIASATDDHFAKMMVALLEIKDDQDGLKATTDLLKLFQGVSSHVVEGTVPLDQIGEAPTKEEFCAHVSKFRWSKSLRCALSKEVVDGDPEANLEIVLKVDRFAKVSMGMDSASCRESAATFEDSLPTIWKKDKGFVKKGYFSTLTGEWHWGTVACCKCGDCGDSSSGN